MRAALGRPPLAVGDKAGPLGGALQGPSAPEPGPRLLPAARFTSAVRALTPHAHPHPHPPPPSVYSIDERSALRKSHENPSVQALYRVGGP